jgi:hypothetical protein
MVTSPQGATFSKTQVVHWSNADSHPGVRYMITNHYESDFTITLVTHRWEILCP